MSFLCPLSFTEVPSQLLLSWACGSPHCPQDPQDYPPFIRIPLLLYRFFDTASTPIQETGGSKVHQRATANLSASSGCQCWGSGYREPFSTFKDSEASAFCVPLHEFQCLHL